MEWMHWVAEHLAEAVVHHGPVYMRVWRIQVYVKGLKVLVRSLTHDVQVTRVRNESVSDHWHTRRHFVALYEVDVESIEDDHEVILGGIGEVGPVEALRVVVAVIHLLNHLVILLLVVALVDVDGVQMECFSQLHQHLHVSSLALCIEVNDRVKNLEDARLWYPLDGGVEVLLLRVEHVNVSILVLARQEIERTFFADDVPDELVLLNPWIILLAAALQNIIFNSVGKNCHLKVVWNFDYSLADISHIDNRPEIWRLIDIKKVNGGGSI